MLDSIFLFVYNTAMKDLRYLQLWDVYGPMLTDNQREICELYYDCDLSLTEIAQEKGVSKQSVSDALIKSRAILDEYEEKLHVNENYKKNQTQVLKKYSKISKALQNFKREHPEFSGQLDKIIDLVEEKVEIRP